MRTFKFGRNPLFLKLITPYRPLKYKPLKKRKIKPVFILATGRTGTKFFAELLNNDPKITALHEPKPSRILRLWTMAYFEGDANENELATVLFAKRKRLMSRIDTPIYIESNPFLVGFLKVLDKVFNDPIIVHVVRDPRDYVRSCVNHGNKRGLKKIMNEYLGYWHPDYNKVLKTDKQLDIGLKYAAYWRIVNEFIYEHGKKKRNYHLFKFEDLFDEKSGELARLVELVGADKSLAHLPSSRQKVNRSRFDDFGKWQDWESPYCKEVEKICGPYMKKFSYGKEKAWKDKIS